MLALDNVSKNMKSYADFFELAKTRLETQGIKFQDAIENPVRFRRRFNKNCHCLYDAKHVKGLDWDITCRDYSTFDTQEHYFDISKWPLTLAIRSSQLNPELINNRIDIIHRIRILRPQKRHDLGIGIEKFLSEFEFIVEENVENRLHLYESRPKTRPNVEIVDSWLNIFS